MCVVSIVIPACNVERYLAECLDSIACQTLADFEAIVVDDASSDGTAQVVRDYAELDPRFRLVCHEENRGLHLTRMTGFLSARGRYALTLDGDDRLVDDTVLARLVREMEADPADVIRFGLVAEPHGKMSEREAAEFQRWSNVAIGPKTGAEMAYLVFDELGDARAPWNVTHRLFRTDLLKQAYGAMTCERLERAEDAYEYLVISTLISCERDACDILGYRYRMGSGVTSATQLSPEAYRRQAAAMRACADAGLRFAQGLGEEHDEFRSCAKGLFRRLTLHAADLMDLRVTVRALPEAARALADVFGVPAASRELWRLVRDHAHRAPNLPENMRPDPRLEPLVRLAEEFDAQAGEGEAARRSALRNQAQRALARMDTIAAPSCDEPSDLRLLVTSDHFVTVPRSPRFAVVQTGPALEFDRWPDAFHEDEGASIAKARDRYAELTTQYWAWKHVHADYLGFFHFHRYLSFSDATYAEGPFGEVDDLAITADARLRYGLDDASILRRLQDHDVLTTQLRPVSSMPTDVRSWFRSTGFSHAGDLERAMISLRERHPDYAVDIDRVLSGNCLRFCNIYVMRADIFDGYCSWLFPLLFDFVERSNFVTRASEELSAPVHLAEVLWTIYLAHAERTGAPWRVGELQTVRFARPELPEPNVPAYELRDYLDPASTYPLAFATDDARADALATRLLVRAAAAGPGVAYDVLVFDLGMSEPRRAAFLDRLRDERRLFVRVRTPEQVAEAVGIPAGDLPPLMVAHPLSVLRALIPAYRDATAGAASQPARTA